MTMMLNQLEKIILERQQNPSEKSYTSSLFKEGRPKIAQKVGEEATEVIVAALAQDREETDWRTCGFVLPHASSHGRY